MTTPIDELVKTPVIGNANGDLKLWLALDEAILNHRLPMKERAAAVRKVYEILGETVPKGSDTKLVRDHVAALKEFAK